MRNAEFKLKRVSQDISFVNQNLSYDIWPITTNAMYPSEFDEKKTRAKRGRFQRAQVKTRLVKAGFHLSDVV